MTVGGLFNMNTLLSSTLIALLLVGCAPKQSAKPQPAALSSARPVVHNFTLQPTTNFGCPADFQEALATPSLVNVVAATKDYPPGTNGQPIITSWRFLHFANSNTTYEVQYQRSSQWYAYVRYNLGSRADWVMTDRPIYACEPTNVLLRVMSN